jgi:hypothetical protein
MPTRAKDKSLESDAVGRRVALCALLGSVFGLDIWIGVSMAEYAIPVAISLTLIVILCGRGEEAWNKKA